MKFTLNINQKDHQVDVEENMPLLWVLRDELNMTGTKFGCGIAFCGACTVLVDNQAVRSCSYPVTAAKGKKITTIEGIATDASLSAVQQAWIDEQVPQCGYCQSGMIMATESLLRQNPNPSLEEIEASITNICRCGTYPRIHKAIQSIAQKVKTEDA